MLPSTRSDLPPYSAAQLLPEGQETSALASLAATHLVQQVFQEFLLGGSVQQRMQSVCV